MGSFFYPSCHPIGRRSFLTGALGAAGSVALGAATALGGATDDSKRIILAYARRHDDPWAIVHAVRALGRELTVDNGQPAVAWVLSEYLREQAVNGGPRHLAFPRRVEVHENSFLKTFLEAGVPPRFGFSHRGQTRTLGDVIDGARALLRFPDAARRHETAWSLIALTRTTPPDRGTWTNAWGERIELARFVEAGFEALEEASRPVQEASDRGARLERLAPVHGFTCGGTHLLYGLLVATQSGYTGSNHRQRVRRQMDLIVYRLWADLDLMNRFYQPKIATNA